MNKNDTNITFPSVLNIAYRAHLSQVSQQEISSPCTFLHMTCWLKCWVDFHALPYPAGLIHEFLWQNEGMKDQVIKYLSLSLSLSSFQKWIWNYSWASIIITVHIVTLIKGKSLNNIVLVFCIHWNTCALTHLGHPPITQLVMILMYIFF